MIRPLNPKAKTILKVAIFLAVVTFVLFIWANARPVPVQVRVTFIGFTNPPAFPISQASYCVSNAGRCSVFRQGVYTIELKNMPQGNFSFGYTAWGDELKPGEFRTISFSTPMQIRRDLHMRVEDQTNLGPWRISMYFSKFAWREKLVRNPPSVLRKVLQFVPAKWLEHHPIEVDSDWINGPELMPVATNTANSPPK